MSLSFRYRMSLSFSLLPLLVVFLSGCAITPLPVEQISSAETAIESAAQSGAEKLAPTELEKAKSKLEYAKKAMQEKENSIAKRLAEESYSDANLARAKADAEKSKNNVEQMAESVRLLKIKIDKSNN